MRGRATPSPGSDPGSVQPPPFDQSVFLAITHSCLLILGCSPAPCYHAGTPDEPKHLDNRPRCDHVRRRDGLLDQTRLMVRGTCCALALAQYCRLMQLRDGARLRFLDSGRGVNAGLAALSAAHIEGWGV